VVGPSLILDTTFGREDAFVARVNVQGAALDYCGYIGGMNFDQGNGIALDSFGNAYVIGYTASDAGFQNFPAVTGPDLSYNGGVDAFVAKIEAFQFTLSATPNPLIAGQSATFSVTGAAPNTSTWLAYSVAGLGATSVPQLQVTFDLSRPNPGAGPTTTNSLGEVSWTVPIPTSTLGLSVWVQAAQMGKISNMIATSIQ